MECSEHKNDSHFIVSKNKYKSFYFILFFFVNKNVFTFIYRDRLFSVGSSLPLYFILNVTVGYCIILIECICCCKFLLSSVLFCSVRYVEQCGPFTFNTSMKLYMCTTQICRISFLGQCCNICVPSKSV